MKQHKILVESNTMDAFRLKPSANFLKTVFQAQDFEMWLNLKRVETLNLVSHFCATLKYEIKIKGNKSELF